MCIVLSKSGAVAYAHLRLRAQKGTNEQETRPAAVAIATVILARYFIFFKRRFWWYCWDGDLGIIAYQHFELDCDQIFVGSNTYSNGTVFPYHLSSSATVDFLFMYPSFQLQLQLLWSKHACMNASDISRKSLIRMR